MSSKRRSYTREFKMEAVRQVRASGRSQREVAGALGVPESNLTRWKKKYVENGDDAFSGDGNLPRELASIAWSLGADLFGVADLRPVHAVVVNQGSQRLKPFTHAMVAAVGLSDTVVDYADFELPVDNSLYGWHLYQAVSPRLDAIAWHLASIVERRGYSALPIPTSQYRSPGDRNAIFSHKLAAHLAGLGWIGKSSLLVTQAFGPRVRLVSVLTDCPLEAGERLDDRCGECEECVAACPAQALTGVEFNDEEGRDVRLNVELCGSYRDGPGTQSSRRGGHVCGLCLAVCPRAYPEQPGWRHPVMKGRSRGVTGNR